MSAGIYLLTFRGATGWGQGLLHLQGGRVTGADMVGCLFDGTYQPTAEGLALDMILTVPPGVVLVMGTMPKTTTYEVPFHVLISTAAIEQSQPVLVHLPPGAVNVIVKRLRRLDDRP